MLSRETRVQLVVVVVAFAVLLGGQALYERVGFGVLGFVVLSAVFNVVVFAGAHLYLAIRGAGGRVPVDARWRFVGVVMAVSTLAVLSRVAWTSSVEWLPTALGALAAVVGLGYLLYEAREGYRASRPA